MHYNDSRLVPFKYLLRLREDQFNHKKFKTSKIDMFESFQEPKLILVDGAPGMVKNNFMQTDCLSVG